MVLAGGYDRVARELVRAERKPDLAQAARHAAARVPHRHRLAARGRGR